MAMTKLTLSADADVVKKAKRVAAANNTSLSAMVDRFLRALVAERKRRPLPPITRGLAGIVKLEDRPLADLLTEALTEKYEKPK